MFSTQDCKKFLKTISDAYPIARFEESHTSTGLRKVLYLEHDQSYQKIIEIHFSEQKTERLFRVNPIPSIQGLGYTDTFSTTRNHISLVSLMVKTTDAYFGFNFDDSIVSELPHKIQNKFDQTWAEMERRLKELSPP